jgi:hypothetical protein
MEESTQILMMVIITNSNILNQKIITNRDNHDNLRSLSAQKQQSRSLRSGFAII